LRDNLRIGPEFLLDDAGVSDRVETVDARATLSDEVAGPIVREGHMERLMNGPDPVAEELERGELGRVIVGRP